MSWASTYNGASITVYKNGNQYAEYDLLPIEHCPKCAAPINPCNLCTDMYGFKGIYAMGLYHKGPPYPELTRHILDLKEDSNIADSLITALDCCIRNRYSSLLDSQIMVPVPIHERKLEERGFNQANVLSSRLANLFGMVTGDILIQTRFYSQRNASRQERFVNVKGAIRLNLEFSKYIRGRKIIVVDDVTTSGATLSECSKVLMDNGAREVNAVVIGRTW